MTCARLAKVYQMFDAKSPDPRRRPREKPASPVSVFACLGLAAVFTAAVAGAAWYGLEKIPVVPQPQPAPVVPVMPGR